MKIPLPLTKKKYNLHRCFRKNNFAVCDREMSQLSRTSPVAVCFHGIIFKALYWYVNLRGSTLGLFKEVFLWSRSDFRINVEDEAVIALTLVL